MRRCNDCHVWLLNKLSFCFFERTFETLARYEALDAQCSGWWLRELSHTFFIYDVPNSATLRGFGALLFVLCNYVCWVLLSIDRCDCPHIFYAAYIKSKPNRLQTVPF